MAAKGGSLLSKVNVPLDSRRRQIDTLKLRGDTGAKYLKKPIAASRLSGLNTDWKNNLTYRAGASGIHAAGVHPVVDRSLEVKLGFLEKQHSKSKVEHQIKKSQVGQLLSTFARGRSTSRDRISQIDSSAFTTNSSLFKVRPSSSHGTLPRSGSAKLNFGIDFSRDKSSIFLPKNSSRTAALPRTWFCTNRDKKDISSSNLLSSKRINMTDINAALIFAGKLDRSARPYSRLDATKRSCKQLLSDTSLFTQPRNHHQMAVNDLKSTGLLYHRISAQKTKSGMMTKNNATSQLLDENKRLFEKKKRAFKESNLE